MLITPAPEFIRRWGLPIAFGASLLGAAWLSHFAVIINDGFALRWQAEHLFFAHPESFYNGFFPIGYPLILRAASVTGNPVLTMMLLHIALASIYAALVYRLIFRLVPGKSALVALPFVLFAPPVIHAIFSATPDFFTALFVLAGVLLLTHAGQRNFLLSGACFGIGCMLRSHILVLALMFAFAISLFHKEMRFRTFLSFCLGVIPFIVLQGLVQVWSGHGFFENAQTFNVWRAMHDMDWSNPPALIHTSVYELILQNPWLFFSSACNWLLHYWFYLAPFVTILVLSMWPIRKKNRMRTIQPQFLLMAAASLAYLVIMAMGGSISAFTTVLPIDGACLALLLQFVFGSEIEARRWPIPVATSICWLAGLAGLLLFSMREANRIEDYSRVERLLNVDSPKNGQSFNPAGPDIRQIYTDDFDFYFPELNYQTPRPSGGWAEVGLPNYLKEFPHIRNSSAQAEHEDLVKNGIFWVIYRIPPYDDRGYRNVLSDSSLFRLSYHTHDHEIYRIEGGGRR